MKKESTINLIILAVTILLVGIMALWWSGHRKGAAGPSGNSAEAATEVSGIQRESPVQEVHTLDISTMEDRFENMGFLITQEYDFKDVMSYSEAQELCGYKLSFTESSYMVTYEGTVTAGVDFTAIKIEKDDDAKTVTVTIPSAEIKDVTIDHDSMEVVDEKKGAFTSISVEEFNDSLVELEEKARTDATEKGILTKADKNAKLVIENLVSEILADSDYTYTVESNNN